MKTTFCFLSVFLMTSLIASPTFAAPSSVPQTSKNVVEENLDHLNDHSEHNVSPGQHKEVHRGHTHGQANAKIVFANREISIEFDLPADDLLSTEEALPILRQHHRIFTLHPQQNDCLIQKTSFERIGLPGGHADFLLQFHWVCENPLVLHSINFRPFFDIASKVEHIEASVIAAGQVLPKATLKKNSAIIQFKKK